ncbi:uncharacterized protein LOC132067888 [Lycium ferocissimum]|uniref:uncharacterized protein LOC132067888 n=1 Tax=Lycium ferocissimum TaxID=112874 RepID=UPI002814CF1A|nr:uncharacterized protein LOC132067888 [Lycium ferocissimum]
MSSNTADPLELLQYVEKSLVASRAIVTPREIENEYSSLYVLADKDLSRIYRYLDTLQRIEEEYGSFRVFSDNSHLVETAERIHQEGISSSHANDYPFLEGPPDVANTMEQQQQQPSEIPHRGIWGG